MVFSSIPTYLDPSNWQQQGGGSIQNHQLITSPPSQTVQQQPSLPPPPAPPQPPYGVGGAGSIRPGSMADRARLANIPMPETPLKCPRCDSSNTKFCYFNNYSLSQPRHFCKTCRRYWTRNGALRNVPVGGGCRRNKRSSSKSSSNNNNNNSKSPASSTSTDGRQPTTNSGSTSTISSHSNSYSGPMSGSAASLLGLMTPQIPQLRFMSPLGQLITHDGHHQFSTTSSNNMNLNFTSSGTGESLLMSNNNNLLGGGGGGGGVASILSSGNIEHWRILQQQQQQQMATHQFPNFLGGFDPTNPNSSIFPFQGGVHHEGVQFLGESTSHQIRPKISTSMLNQMASVKMEDHNNQDQSTLSRQLSGIPTGNQENWTTNASAWSDLSASFSSSSTSNAL